MKIVTGQVMAAIDRGAIRDWGIPSLSLMEHAGWSVACELHRLCQDPTTPILFLCGRGNNGGDGFVAARHLLGWGYRPKVLLSHPVEKLSGDGRVNFERYSQCPFADWNAWGDVSDHYIFSNQPVVVDALLGTGSKGAPEAPLKDMIRLANQEARWILGVDMPSGVDSVDGSAEGEAPWCRSTLTFGLPKQGHFLRDGLDLTGSLSVADIGFPRDLLESAEAEAELITGKWVRSHLPSYAISAHKGVKGRTLLVAGSPGMLGAALLAARACLASGSGLATLALPRSLNLAAKAAVPEVMTLPLPETLDGSISKESLGILMDAASRMDAAGIGPGLGGHPETAELACHFIEACPVPLVIDADGLNSLQLSGAGKILGKRSGSTVLTPHPGEMGRLVGITPEEVESDRWKVARQAAEDLKCTILLKGAASVIATRGSLLKVNRTGHPAMAQGGMGDALTGMILSLLGQLKDAHVSACLAAFLHGRAGEQAVRDGCGLSISAGALADRVGTAVRSVMGGN